ncbi:hypothetical protein ACLI08_02020 [Flavobacterium sp. RNTU_13]|uniref:hypothetical protein n=1 Tax=Flavobacterium sp. RNTU_13 TaxID=3375145 RepID=UPI0039883156
MHISIFRTIYKNVIDNQRIELLLQRHNISFEKTLYDKGSRYKIASDNEDSINIFKKQLNMIYPQIAL